ncbi:NAD(P)-dependent oxidoreductase [Lacticaseibacillus rhamnosus]|uniref:NAD(P)-dependent oxidoreductase n=1 Tax=Lacticaseibacillus rhamnosus TaxID=47715 RepID=UPI003B9B5C21
MSRLKLGFIGTGVMGTGIVKNFLNAGHEVIVYNRTKAHAQTVLDAGATWAESPHAVAAQCHVVMSMVGFPQDVETVYYGCDGVLAGTHAGDLIIDMTTSTPTLAKSIASKAADKGAHAIDAPVSGGDIGAKNGTLTIMVGGEKNLLSRLKDLFAPIATSVNYFGPAGSGQHAKMANQIMIAGTMTGLTEMLVYGKAARLDLNEMLTVVGSGAGANWSLSNYGPRMLQADYTPGFFAKHFLKDLRIALDEAKKMHLQLPATQLAEQLYANMVAAGKGDLGTQGLVTMNDHWRNA